MQTAEELSKRIGKRVAYSALGLPRSSLYRAQKPRRTQTSPKASPRALSQPEKDAVRQELNSERFQNFAPREVYATLMDEERYLCSWRSMYRILSENDEVREAQTVQSMYVPLVKENKDKEHPPRQLTITLRSTGDHERDKRRIKTLHGLLTAQHGRDKFSFQIFENNKGYLIDFPNDTTRICPELLARLKKLIGEEVWRVDEIVFQ